MECVPGPMNHPKRSRHHGFVDRIFSNLTVPVAVNVMGFNHSSFAGEPERGCVVELGNIRGPILAILCLARIC